MNSPFRLIILAFCASASLLLDRSQHTSATLTSVDQPFRTGYHFQPPKNWINDPNAPMYYKGVYHLFYQYNPRGAIWGNIIWAHSISTNLIDWKHLEPALHPSEPFDIGGCWSGSATVLPGKGPVILYTGLDMNKTEFQNAAVPANLSDPYLRVWVKPEYNPVVAPTPDMNASCFRDPTTAWLDNGEWKMVVGGREKGTQRGMAHLYRSRDFRRWVKAEQPLHSVPDTGMWECPDFYPVGPAKYVLKVSVDETRLEYYTVGRYDTEEGRDTYVPDDPSLDGWNGLRYDYGNFYASKSFYDPSKDRRVLWGWVNESDSPTMDKEKGWAGIQAIPRKVWLDETGKQVVQWPVEELEGLRHTHVKLSGQRLQMADVLSIEGVTAAQADVEVVFRLPDSLEGAEPFDPSWVNAQDLCKRLGSDIGGGIGPFGLLTLASPDLDEFTPVFFRVFKAHNTKHVVLMCSDASRSTLISDKHMYKPSYGGFVDVDLHDRKLHLRSLIDQSVIESFAAKGKTCITSRIYPINVVSHETKLYAFNNGSEPIFVEKLDAWSMKSSNGSWDHV